MRQQFDPIPAWKRYAAVRWGHERDGGPLPAGRHAGEYPAQLPAGDRALRGELGRLPTRHQRQHRALPGRPRRHAGGQYAEAAPRGVGPVARHAGFSRPDQGTAGAPGTQGHSHPAPETGEAGRTAATTRAGAMRGLAGEGGGGGPSRRGPPALAALLAGPGLVAHRLLAGLSQRRTVPPASRAYPGARRGGHAAVSAVEQGRPR
ncbi:hypothetical protein FQZ97_928140 [compost metagenome]